MSEERTSIARLLDTEQKVVQRIDEILYEYTDAPSAAFSEIEIPQDPQELNEYMQLLSLSATKVSDLLAELDAEFATRESELQQVQEDLSSYNAQEQIESLKNLRALVSQGLLPEESLIAIYSLLDNPVAKVAEPESPPVVESEAAETIQELPAVVEEPAAPVAEEQAPTQTIAEESSVPEAQKGETTSDQEKVIFRSKFNSIERKIIRAMEELSAKGVVITQEAIASTASLHRPIVSTNLKALRSKLISTDGFTIQDGPKQGKANTYIFTKAEPAGAFDDEAESEDQLDTQLTPEAEKSDDTEVEKIESVISPIVSGDKKVAASPEPAEQSTSKEAVIENPLLDILREKPRYGVLSLVRYIMSANEQLQKAGNVEVLSEDVVVKFQQLLANNYDLSTALGLEIFSLTEDDYLQFASLVEAEDEMLAQVLIEHNEDFERINQAYSQLSKNYVEDLLTHVTNPNALEHIGLALSARSLKSQTPFDAYVATVREILIDKGFTILPKHIDVKHVSGVKGVDIAVKELYAIHRNLHWGMIVGSKEELRFTVTEVAAILVLKKLSKLNGYSHELRSELSDLFTP